MCTVVRKQNFKDLFETGKRSFISASSICMTVSLKVFSRPGLLLHKYQNLHCLWKFTIILFFLNQSVTLFPSLCKFFINCDNVYDKLVKELSSAKLYRSEFLVLIRRSFVKLLNRMGLSIDL